MKNFNAEKENLLISIGYGENSKFVGEGDYIRLPEEEKCKYVKTSDGPPCATYTKDKEVVKCTDNELSTILQMEMYNKFSKMEKHLKIIKYCSVFFVLLTVISIIAAYSLIS